MENLRLVSVTLIAGLSRRVDYTAPPTFHRCLRLGFRWRTHLRGRSRWGGGVLIYGSFGYRKVRAVPRRSIASQADEGCRRRIASETGPAGQSWAEVVNSIISRE